MLFRRAVSADIPTLIEFRRILLNRETDRSMDTLFEEYFNTSISNGSLVVWVADDNGIIVSCVCFCICQLIPRFDSPSGSMAYMANVYTALDYRRRGIASTLINRAIDDLKTIGIGKIILNSSDMGKPMYENLGFAVGKGYMSKNI
ncbi:Acetyltransferase (GNAT) family protein [compost metagenome]